MSSIIKDCSKIDLEPDDQVSPLYIIPLLRVLIIFRIEYGHSFIAHHFYSVGTNDLVHGYHEVSIVKGLESHRCGVDGVDEADFMCVDEVIAVADVPLIVNLTDGDDQIGSLLVIILVTLSSEHNGVSILEPWFDLERSEDK